MSPTRTALPDLPQATWIADRIVAGDAEATVRVNDAEGVVNQNTSRCCRARDERPFWVIEAGKRYNISIRTDDRSGSLAPF
jgi:hypothetical protein